MSSGKIRKFTSIFSANGGCSGCGSNSADSIIEPKPVSKISFSDQNPSRRRPSSSDSFSWRYGGGCRKSAAVDGDEDRSSTTFSLTIDTSPAGHYCPEKQQQQHDDRTKCPKIKDSFAVVKDSDDPYQDFRQSMLQMIFEKEIYTRNDLQQLLDCFLQLNSSRYHEVIVRAFMEIWNGGVPAAAAADGGGEAAPPCSSTRFT
ncbi:hypothetical protein ACP275_04G220400 [Erythranthe tilingii]